MFVLKLSGIQKKIFSHFLNSNLYKYYLKIIRGERFHKTSYYIILNLNLRLNIQQANREPLPSLLVGIRLTSAHTIWRSIKERVGFTLELFELNK